MNIQEFEIQRAEEYLISQFPPLVKTFILNSPKVNKIVEKYEQLIMSFMNENGSVNGKFLNKILVEKYPQIAQWISIPQYDFYLKDEIEKILNVLIRR